MRLVLADVDGTLVTPEKALTSRAISAVLALHEAGVMFAVTSGRPPRGMSMLIEPLHLKTPLAAFNGGLIVDSKLAVLEQRVIPEQVVADLVKLLQKRLGEVWLYRGADWYVQDPRGPHVARETTTVEFQPQVVRDYQGMVEEIAKMVGVSDDEDAIGAAAKVVEERFAAHVSSALSQPYYLDITHPRANKGEVVRYLADAYHIRTDQIATIGDMPNDVMMFADSGLSIAMGQADREVKEAADQVTASNSDEGFAQAMEQFILA